MIIFLFLFVWVMNVVAGVYTEIPKTFTKNITHAKDLKFGYNLTNNISQKQSLFFIEGILRNDKINHDSRYEIYSAKTEDGGVIYANTGSNLLRTNTIFPLFGFIEEGIEDNINENSENINENDNPFSVAGIVYGRLYNFSDKLTASNDLKDQIVTVGIGFSKTNIYTFGISIGKRNADVFFDSTKQNINESIYRPSFVYTNTVERVIPRFLKKLFERNSIFEFATTETSIKIEYALIAAQNTNIQQFYAGIEKNISKHIAIAIFYDIENTRNTHPLTQQKNVNKIEKISTSLIIKL